MNRDKPAFWEGVASLLESSAAQVGSREIVSCPVLPGGGGFPLAPRVVPRGPQRSKSEILWERLIERCSLCRRADLLKGVGVGV